MANRNWQKDIQPLIKKYKGKKFSLKLRSATNETTHVDQKVRKSEQWMTFHRRSDK